MVFVKNLLFLFPGEYAQERLIRSCSGQSAATLSCRSKEIYNFFKKGVDKRSGKVYDSNVVSGR